MVKESGFLNSVRRLVDRRFGKAHADRRRLKRQIRRFKSKGGIARLAAYPWLDGASVVVDLGAYEGRWTDDILVRRPGMVHLFEPHPRFAAALSRKYAGRRDVRVHDVALASTSGPVTLSDMGDASSVYLSGGPSVQASMVEAVEYLSTCEIGRIDLLKMNIEGGEYDLLEHMISKGLMRNVGTLLIQFHKFDERDEHRREATRTMLSATHREDWSFPFVWEQWSAA